ncbi:hypothetical protein KM043_016041 [Ampulex compressa]|nr:hypothetical protein KM043_016041 [Ampulex compressa]
MRKRKKVKSKRDVDEPEAREKRLSTPERSKSKKLVITKGCSLMDFLFEFNLKPSACVIRAEQRVKSGIQRTGIIASCRVTRLAGLLDGYWLGQLRGVQPGQKAPPGLATVASTGRETGQESRVEGLKGRGGVQGDRKGDSGKGVEVGMDERQMNESLHERNSYRIRETPYGVPATWATRRLIGIRPWQSKQGFL